MPAIVDVAGVTRANAYMVPPEELYQGKNSRRWADTEISELAQDIFERGQLVPILVAWEKGEDDTEHLVVVDGNRRVSAIRYINENPEKFKNKPPLKVLCQQFKGAEKFSASVVTNLKRRGLSAIDRAHSIATLEEEGKTRKDIAKLLEVSEATVSQDLKLLSLSAAIQKDIHKGKIAASVGYELAGMEPAERTKALETSTTTAGESGQAEPKTKPTRTSVRKAKREAAEKGAETKGSTARSRKEVYSLFTEWAACEDGTIAEGIRKLCITLVKYMDGETGDRAVLNRMRELEGE